MSRRRQSGPPQRGLAHNGRRSPAPSPSSPSRRPRDRGARRRRSPSSPAPTSPNSPPCAGTPPRPAPTRPQRRNLLGAAPATKPTIAMIRGFCLGGGMWGSRSPATSASPPTSSASRRPPRRLPPDCIADVSQPPSDPSAPRRCSSPPAALTAAEALEIGLLAAVHSVEALENTGRSTSPPSSPTTRR